MQCVVHVLKILLVLFEKFFGCGPALFGAKNFEFFEIYGVSARTEGLSQYGHFSDKEEGGQFFTILCGCLL